MEHPERPGEDQEIGYLDVDEDDASSERGAEEPDVDEERDEPA